MSLLTSARDGNLEAVKQHLADPDVNINRRNSKNGTALIHAAYHGHTECVRLLIEAGADLFLEDEDGTALDNARLKGHNGIVTLLENAESIAFGPYRKLNEEEELQTERRPDLGQKITRLFNFRAMTMKETTQNLSTKAESSFVLHFSNPAIDLELIHKAKDAFIDEGGIVNNNQLHTAINNPTRRSTRQIHLRKNN